MFRLDEVERGRYSCTMTQVRNKHGSTLRRAGRASGPAAARAPLTPKQAMTHQGPVDGLLSVEFFKALSDSTRVSLLGCLVKCGRACSVGEIAECCSVDLSVVSRHLRMLERAGLISSEKKGRVVSYRVRYAEWSRALRDLAAAIESCCPEGGVGCCGEGSACCAKGAGDGR